jgi:deoxyribose-phosphate aldolase
VHVEELAKTIDHTLLRPDGTAHDVERLCREAVRYHFASVCVFPYFVPLAHHLVGTADVKVCTVVAFPYGAEAARTKVVAAQDAVRHGADELDVVMNIPAMLSGEFGRVRDELASVVHAVRLGAVNSGKGPVIIKAIIETCYLSKKMKKLACTIVERAGCDFVKTSTGVGPHGATVQDVELLRDCVGPHVGVKASGGIRTWRDASRMINAGATRLGTSAGPAIVEDYLGSAASGSRAAGRG